MEGGRGVGIEREAVFTLRFQRLEARQDAGVCLRGSGCHREGSEGTRRR